MGNQHRRSSSSLDDTREEGADAILIMPPFSFTWGATQYPGVVFKYFSDIDRAVDALLLFFNMLTGPIATTIAKH